ncbi:DUF4145 domain-containing protein [Stenomitos frigidus]|uniref:DUF4145 domain-containing protein n=1 Tax=Stenomitos frigidus ULC18 TaxID=2107698 RepID=A0A2T1DW64_9CYAN|nr:DUF4145 domain-containing protein [Stenomitos frigidus]PSB24738.1 hypothetical protein C7B82_25335 [Stenomitos frigidus ULC18]
MPGTINYYTNKTQGEEYSLQCIQCTGKTTHKVLVSVDIRGTKEEGTYSLSWWIDNQIVQCLGCKTVSFREASSNDEEYYPISHDAYEYNVDERLYPPRIEGIKGLGRETHYLPSNVYRIYNENLIALSCQASVLAGIGLRALLETVCKEKEAVGNDLLKKIDSLVSKGILTPASAAILHKIRTLGNAAAHEVKPHNEKQLALAMDIVEHLLKDVYILPKQVESEF